MINIWHKGKVIKAGSWYNPAWLTRSYIRRRYILNDRINNIGFRLIRSKSKLCNT